jgi:hypothetical protein
MKTGPSFIRAAILEAALALALVSHAETPPPKIVKVERLAGEQIRVTLGQLPADAIRIDWRSRSITGTWGVGRPVEPLSNVFVLEGFRRYRPYSFEVKVKGKDGWSDGAYVEIPPAPFQLGPVIDYEDLCRRPGWRVDREWKPIAPLLITATQDFDGDQFAVLVVLYYEKGGKGLLDKNGNVLNSRLELKLPKGQRELRVPFDKVIEEALKRLGDSAKRPKDMNDIVLLLIPAPTGSGWVRRERVVSGVPQAIYFPEPRMTFGIDLGH